MVAYRWLASLEQRTIDAAYDIRGWGLKEWVRAVLRAIIFIVLSPWLLWALLLRVMFWVFMFAMEGDTEW